MLTLINKKQKMVYEAENFENYAVSKYYVSDVCYMTSQVPKDAAFDEIRAMLANGWKVGA